MLTSGSWGGGWTAHRKSSSHSRARDCTQLISSNLLQETTSCSCYAWMGLRKNPSAVNSNARSLHAILSTLIPGFNSNNVRSPSCPHGIFTKGFILGASNTSCTHSLFTRDWFLMSKMSAAASLIRFWKKERSSTRIARFTGGRNSSR